MCGRYAIATSRLARIENALGVALPAPAPRYNVAPTQMLPIVRATAERRYELVEARWGLIPIWSKEPRTAYATFNARVETVAGKPAFRAAYRARRCSACCCSCRSLRLASLSWTLACACSSRAAGSISACARG